MRQPSDCSRRGFLRVALNAGALAALGSKLSQGDAAVTPDQFGEDAMFAARVELARDVYDSRGTLYGKVYFRRAPAGPVNLEWIDGAGRIVREVDLPTAEPGRPRTFSLALADGLTYRNALRVTVGGVPQVADAQFLLSPAPEPWDDFHAIMWADYPDSFYDLLARAGVDATIAYRDDDFGAVLDNNFHFYNEQLAWEVFAIYHKNQPLWRGWQEKFSINRDDWKLLVRNPCLNDPSTDEYLRTRLTRMVRMHKAFRPLYYTIADELGHGDQIQPTDFCHSSNCTVKFAQYLRELYGEPGNVGQEWGNIEVARWDDDTMRSGLNWDHAELMITRTTTDRAFDSIAFAGLRARYGGVIRLNREWGTTFPEPRGVGMNARDEWEPVIAMAAEARSVLTLDEHALEAKLGPLDAANARWGRRGGWKTTHQPTRFRNWSDVLGFVKRFYAEVTQIRSTEGWNVASWCDFRNFMDQTFAEAVHRAAAVCKAEDPEARCGTEGGQAPAAFGWYNYQRVVEAVDVIEPYNTANNAEIVRSLDPKVAMLGTHDFEYTPGKALTDADRTEQKRKGREIWWQLFHGYRASIIWDNLEANYRFVDPDGRELTPAAEAFSEVFHEVRAGIARLVMNSRRTHDGIAIHYSHASIQIHWLLDNLRFARDWVVHHVDDRGHFNGIRNSWTKLVEDLNLQYEFISREQIEAGKLASGEYRIFIMPKSVAVGDREADQIREFARRGGLVVADYAAATMNEHGRDLGRGQLDDVFGLARSKPQAAGARLRGTAHEDSLKLEGMDLGPLPVAEPNVVTRGGRALAVSGDVPAVIVNRLGHGRAVFLNLDVADYAVQRLQPEVHSTLPSLVEGILSLAGVRPRVRVLGSDGKNLPGTEVVIFQNGACEHIAVFRNPQFDLEGLGDAEAKPGPRGEEIDNSFFETPAEIALEWDSAQHAYDVRGKRDLGKVQAYKTTLGSWWPLIVTRSPDPLPKLRLEVPSTISSGEPLKLKLATDAAGPEGAVRVVRFEFRKPDGQTYELYARNALVRSTPHTEQVPLAVNDPKGRWQVRAHDVMSGQVLEASFEVS